MVTMFISFMIAICSFAIWVIIDSTNKCIKFYKESEEERKKNVGYENTINVDQKIIKDKENTIEKQKAAVLNVLDQLGKSEDMRKILSDQVKQLEKDLSISHKLWNDLNTKHTQLEKEHKAICKKHKVSADSLKKVS